MNFELIYKYILFTKQKPLSGGAIIPIQKQEFPLAN